MRRSPAARPGQAVYSQNRDYYGVQGCGRGGGGSEVWLHVRVLQGCEAGCEVLVEHGSGSSDDEDKQSQCCRAPILSAAAARPYSRERALPQWFGLEKRARGMLGQRVIGDGHGRGCLFCVAFSFCVL